MIMNGFFDILQNDISNIFGLIGISGKKLRTSEIFS